MFLDLPPAESSILRALSIKTVYADKIRERSKLWELRTYSPNVPQGEWIALYESRPTQAIQTIVQIGRTFKLHPDDAWQQYEPHLGIEFEDFFLYFRKRKFAFGLEIQDVRSFDPISLASLR
jgi:predicted transcriptional regulator